MTKSKQTYNRNHCYSPARITKDGLVEVASCRFSKHVAGCISPNAREEDSILKNIPIETNFFFCIENYDKNFNLLYSERGIGELTKSDGRTILDRQTVFSQWDDVELTIVPNNDGIPREIPVGGWFNLTTYTPIHTSQLFISEHSVLCSIDKNTPAIVPLEEGTLLGRLDGRIQSIDSDELKFILGDNIKRALEDSTGNLHLQVKEIDLKARNSIIMTNQIQLKPQKQRPRRFSVGSLYYNDKKKVFEFHDGEKWRRLVAE